MLEIKINDKFGNLTIFEILESKKTITNNKVSCRKRYNSICNCGNTRIVTGQYLRKTNNPSCKTCKFNSRKQSLKSDNPYKRLYKLCERSALKRNKIFELTIEEFIKLSTSNCYYCNDIPETVLWKTSRIKNKFIRNGIDRINNNLGYIKNNCVSCCKFCNIAKSTNNVDDFKNKILKIYHNFIEKNKTKE